MFLPKRFLRWEGGGFEEGTSLPCSAAKILQTQYYCAFGLAALELLASSG